MPTPDEILDLCWRAGITLLVVPEGLEVKPMDRVGPWLRDQIKEHRDALIELLCGGPLRPTPEAEGEPMTTPFELPPTCPNCRSTSLERLNAELARCEGCGASLMKDARHGQYARIASLFGPPRTRKARPVGPTGRLGDW